MKKLTFILILIAFVGNAQHVPILSQYMFNDLALNPANTGNQEALSLFSNFRAQWVGIPGAPTTQSFSAHSPLRQKSSSVGVQFFADQIGVNRNAGIFGSYAYRIDLKTSRLSFGLSAGVSLVRSNNGQLLVNDNGDNSLTDSPLGVLPDASFGVSWNAKKYFMSFSIPMFLGHAYDGNKFRVDHDFRNYNMMLGGGYALEYAGGKLIIPSLLLKYKPGNRPQADINVMAELHEIIDAGLSYRTEEAIIALIKVKPTQQLSVMYSFGMPVTPISYKQFGSHEIGLKYTFLYKTNISSSRYLGW